MLLTCSVDLAVLNFCTLLITGKPEMLDDTSRIRFLDIVAVIEVKFAGIALSFSPSRVVSVKVNLHRERLF